MELPYVEPHLINWKYNWPFAQGISELIHRRVLPEVKRVSKKSLQADEHERIVPHESLVLALSCAATESDNPQGVALLHAQ